MEMRLASTDPKEIEYILRSTVVELSFDGETTVWCPASDFFGSGVGLNGLRSWYRTVSTDGTMRCSKSVPSA